MEHGARSRREKRASRELFLRHSVPTNMSTIRIEVHWMPLGDGGASCVMLGLRRGVLAAPQRTMQSA